MAQFKSLMKDVNTKVEGHIFSYQINADPPFISG